MPGELITIILSSNKLNEPQKKTNIWLNWIIPFVWALIVKIILKEPKIKVMTKRNRRRKSGGGTDNWGHLTGDGGFDSYGSGDGGGFD